MEFKYRTFQFEDDYDGPVDATLINLPAEKPTGKAVLYIHGYTDYFFQNHMAEEFMRNGYNFYAVDLRKYGRSLHEWQHPNYARSMREYYPELTESIRAIRKDGNSEIVLLGHSTGGLLAALYMDDGPEEERKAIKAAVLNSPFLEFNEPWFNRRIGIPIVAGLGRLFPYAHISGVLSPLYAKSLHKDHQGEWDFDPRLKPIDGIPLYFAWLRAIRKGHKQVKRGLQIETPILVMSSDRSFYGKEWSPEIMHADAVLNVKDIERYAGKLGSHVTYRPIPGGLHDLFLSPLPVRKEAFRVMFEWLAVNV